MIYLLELGDHRLLIRIRLLRIVLDRNIDVVCLRLDRSYPL